MYNIIITGATSFIGVHLIRQLMLDKDIYIYAVIRRNSNKKELIPKAKQIQLIESNMDEYHFLSQRIPDACDACFALAWNGTRGKARNNGKQQYDNYKYSMDFIKEAAMLGCTKIISAGSQAEYGKMDGITTENSPQRPNTEYGKAKLRFYQDAFDYCRKKDISFKEPRFFSLYGEGDNSGTMILSILNDMLHDRPCMLTECKQDWNFLHIDDAINGLVLLLTEECEDGAYNFASEDTRKLKKFVEQMYQLTQSKSELKYGVLPYPETGIVSMKPSAQKLMKQTGWRPKISFADGILSIVHEIQKSGKHA